MTELEFMKSVAARLSEALAQIAELLDMQGQPIEPEEVVAAVRRRVKGDVMERDKLVAAVVEAARHWANAARPYRNDYSGDARAIIDAIDALDASPPQPAETVTLAVWQDNSGETWLCAPGEELDRMRGDWRGWTRLGTITLPLEREA